MRLVLSLEVAVRSARDELHDLERHVMRCRRREEAASVLVARVNRRPGLSQAELLAWCRLTDSVAVKRVRGAFELIGVFDDEALDRTGVERRLSSTARADVHLAWARFPDDGVTLEALLAAGRAALPAAGRRRALPPRAQPGVSPSPVASGAEPE